MGTPSPVPMGQRRGTVPAVSSQKALGVAFADSHDLGGLGDGKLVFQNAVEHLDPSLFLLIQFYIPHRDDIFAEQLAGDRIVEHQQKRVDYLTCIAPFVDTSLDSRTESLCHSWKSLWAT